MVLLDTSTSGVPVIPDGSMFPPGRSLLGTGVPRLVLHATAPVAASREATVFPSVATRTRSPTTKGCA